MTGKSLSGDTPANLKDENRVGCVGVWGWGGILGPEAGKELDHQGLKEDPDASKRGGHKTKRSRK